MVWMKGHANGTTEETKRNETKRKKRNKKLGLDVLCLFYLF